jgi:hypothetical protein
MSYLNNEPNSRDTSLLGKMLHSNVWSKVFRPNAIRHNVPVQARMRAITVRTNGTGSKAVGLNVLAPFLVADEDEKFSNVVDDR